MRVAMDWKLRREMKAELLLLLRKTCKGRMGRSIDLERLRNQAGQTEEVSRLWAVVAQELVNENPQITIMKGPGTRESPHGSMCISYRDNFNATMSLDIATTMERSGYFARAGDDPDDLLPWEEDDDPRDSLPSDKR